MENIAFTYKMLGIVTLYNPDKEQALANIRLYHDCLDMLIVWDNSSDCHKEWFEGTERCLYHWTGDNSCIAPAINYAWRHAVEHEYDLLLVMDEDSQWTDFMAYRKDIERMQAQGKDHLYTPYVEGCDTFRIEHDIHEKRVLINSGTVIPTTILTAIGGINEDAFPLDALDHDISYSAQENGYDILCLTRHKLSHSLGYPKCLGPFRLFTPDYNSFRTYHMTRSHIICYRKHRALMTSEDKDYLYKEILLRKFARIILAEPDKVNRLRAFIKGITQGITYKL